MKRNFLVWLLFLGVAGFFAHDVSAGSAVVLGSNGVYAYAFGRELSRTAAEQKALQLCSKKGGVDVKVISSAGGGGYSSIAVSGKEKEAVLGVSLGAANPSLADSNAIQDCKGKGGANAHIVNSWRPTGGARGSHNTGQASGQGSGKL